MNLRGKPSPTANITHYCRVCEEVFPPSVGDTAHAEALSHRIKEHNPDERYSRCSRYCDQREQAEETAAGRQLYGQVVPPRPKLAVGKSYRALFPEDD